MPHLQAHFSSLILILVCIILISFIEVPNHIFDIFCVVTSYILANFVLSPKIVHAYEAQTPLEYGASRCQTLSTDTVLTLTQQHDTCQKILQCPNKTYFFGAPTLLLGWTRLRHLYHFKQNIF